MQRIFGRKRDKGTETIQVKKLTKLEEFLSDDKETYEALAPIMFLDPRKIETPMKDAADRAKKSEKEKDFAAAKMWYQVAGGLALYEGDVKKVVEYYTGAERVSGKKYLILKIPEKAVAKAREYYKKYLQE